MATTNVRNNSNSKGEADDNEGTGEEGLDSLVNLKPSGGRGPKVSRH